MVPCISWSETLPRHVEERLLHPVELPFLPHASLACLSLPSSMRTEAESGSLPIQSQCPPTPATAQGFVGMQGLDGRTNIRSTAFWGSAAGDTARYHSNRRMRLRGSAYVCFFRTQGHADPSHPPTLASRKPRAHLPIRIDRYICCC